MRARNIKPGFFINEDLPNVCTRARLLYIGLWLLADREGRLEDRPKRIQGELFRFEGGIDCNELLEMLSDEGFIVRYEVNGIKYIWIPTFLKHQTPHVKERTSTIPVPDKTHTSIGQVQKRSVPAPPDSLNPESPNPVLPPDPPQGGLFVSSDSSSSQENGTATSQGIPPGKSDLEKATQEMLETVAGMIHGRHRQRKCSLTIVKAKLRTIIATKPANEQLATLAFVDRGHDAWCKSDDWTREDGRYQKGLEFFLNPQKERWMDPAPVFKHVDPEDKF